MKRKIRWIQIGVGHDHALETLNAALALQEDFEVLGAVITEEDRRDYPEKAAAAAKLCKVLTIEQAEKLRPEAAAIETEDEYLAKYGVLCAKKGWHLHVDKPAATKAEDFAALLGAVRESGVALQTGYMYRYNPAICRAIEKIESGALGEIYAIEAQMSCLHPEEKRRWLKKYQGGMTMYLGCHLIDIGVRQGRGRGRRVRIVPLSPRHIVYPHHGGGMRRIYAPKNCVLRRKRNDRGRSHRAVRSRVPVAQQRLRRNIA